MVEVAGGVGGRDVGQEPAADLAAAPRQVGGLARGSAPRRPSWWGSTAPAQKRASLRWLRKQRTRVLALVPRGSQLTTSKRPPPHGVEPGRVALHQADAAVAGPPGLMNIVPIRSLRLAGEVADQREADRAPVRAVPVQRHPDPGALQILPGGSHARPRRSGHRRPRRRPVRRPRREPVRAQRRPRRRPRTRRRRPWRRGSGARGPPAPETLDRGRPAGAASGGPHVGVLSFRRRRACHEWRSGVQHCPEARRCRRRGRPARAPKPPVVSLAARAAGEDEPVFRAQEVRDADGELVRGGGPLDGDNLKRSWARALRRAGVRHVPFHSLRHTAVSLLIAAGANPKRSRR